MVLPKRWVFNTLLSTSFFFLLCVYQCINFSLLHQHILLFKQIIMAEVSNTIILC